MKTLTIVHPYGKISDLPWESENGIPFGFSANRENLPMMSDQIRTYTEQIENKDVRDTIKMEMASAEALVFLGFSYQDLNMKVLDPEASSAVRDVFGTALKISDSDVEQIKEQVRLLIRANLTENRVLGGIETITERLHIRSDLSCARLREEYSRRLFVAGGRSQS